MKRYQVISAAVLSVLLGVPAVYAQGRDQGRNGSGQTQSGERRGGGDRQGGSSRGTGGGDRNQTPRTGTGGSDRSGRTSGGTDRTGGNRGSTDRTGGNRVGTDRTGGNRVGTDQTPRYGGTDNRGGTSNRGGNENRGNRGNDNRGDRGRDENHGNSGRLGNENRGNNGRWGNGGVAGRGDVGTHRPSRTEWIQHRARNFNSEHRSWRDRGGYRGYRIPDTYFRSHFGRSHRFRGSRVNFVFLGGSPAFDYGDYRFTLAEPYPEYWGDNWYESDDFYVDYVNDGYYLFDSRFPDRPGVALSVNLRL